VVDRERLLPALSGASVEFIVVGGVAAIVHGSARLTQDLNIVYRRPPGSSSVPAGIPTRDVDCIRQGKSTYTVHLITRTKESSEVGMFRKLMGPVAFVVAVTTFVAAATTVGGRANAAPRSLGMVDGAADLVGIASDSASPPSTREGSPVPPRSALTADGPPEKDTTGQTLYALDGIGRLYKISPYSANPDRFLLSNGLYYRALGIDPATLRAYAVSNESVLYEIKLTNGGHIQQVGQIHPQEPRAMAFNRQGQAYVIANLERTLYRLDMTNATLTGVGDTGYYLYTIAFDGDGTLYGSVGVGPGRGSLVRINPTTGASIVVGTPGAFSGLAVDTDGTLYGAAGSGLYSIDKNTGQATLIGTVGMSAINNLAFLRAPSSSGGGAPTADFTWSPAAPVVGQAVQFTDLSTGTPTSWSWNIDGIGGDDSTARNPTWTYVAPGAYTVTLRACNASGCSSRTRPVSVTNPSTATIRISGPAHISQLSLAQFTASATGCTPTRFGWRWTTPDADLGDGGPFVGALGEPATVFRGWTAEGSHTIEVRNTGCPGAVPGRAIITVGPRDAHTTTIHPRREDAPAIPFDGRTVVFCHGLEPTGLTSEQLWSCVRDPGLGLFCDESKVAHPVDELLPYASHGYDIHGLQFTWSGAFQGLNYPGARSLVGSAAMQLAAALDRRLPTGYQGPIQFVGHSLGSAVCALAAKRVLELRPNIRELQLTTLDRPDHVEKLGVRMNLGFGPEWTAGVFANSTRPGLSLAIDNYWSTTGTGVGDSTSCVPGVQIYNHEPLLHPGGLADSYFSPESGADHSGVHQWYRWTMDADRIAQLGGDPAVCLGAAPHLSGNLDASLNPCAAGWNYSIVREASAPPTHACDPIVVTNPSLAGWCASAGGVSTPCQNLANPPLGDADLGESGEKESQITVDVPAFARALTFNMTVSRPSSASAAVVLLDTFPLWLGSLGPFTPNTPAEVGPIPIEGLTGQRRLSVKVVDGDSGVVVNNFRAQRILPGCESGNALCIAAHRFRVEAEWTDYAGNTGHASPRYVSADESGFMWFFNPSNLELVVKILNGCGLSSPRFWVFAAGLTDVGVRLKVTDTQTGAVRYYENPAGQAFQPIQDTNAFATCAATDAATSGDRVLSGGSPVAGDEVANSVGKSLWGGRFDVRATWRTADGASGEGHFVQLTNETGYLWFFDPSNIEAAVKVIDGCRLNNRYWVFAAGLTNVQVDLTVTDIRTGATATYQNPLNQNFQPIQDTNALATCP